MNTFNTEQLRVNKLVLTDKRLSPIDSKVYLALSSKIKDNNWTKPLVINDLRKISGVSRSAVARSLKHLKKINLIEIKRKQHSQLFHLNQ